MGTEVLSSHDCLRSSFPQPVRGFPARHSRRNRRDCARAPTKAPDHLAMGQVTILRRGEALPKKPSVSDRCSPDLAEKKKAIKATLGLTGGRRKQSKDTAGGRLKKKVFVTDKDSVLPSTGRMRRDLAPKQVPADVSFSGSVSFISPSPSDLPFPFSFAKKNPNGNYYASEDLRRLLRI